MKRHLSRAALSLILLTLAALSCALPNVLPGAGSLTKTTDLWGDVPRMDGLEHSDKDLPLYARLVVQTVMPKKFLAARAPAIGSSSPPARRPTISPSFYTNDLMAENGWEASDTSTCVDGSAQGVTEAGLLCVFQKQEADRYVGLAIIAGEDAETKETNIIFIRVEAEQTPTPGS